MRGAPPEAAGIPELEGGLVTASRRRHYAVLLDSGTSLECLLKGRSTTLACGDRADVRRGIQDDGAHGRYRVESFIRLQGMLKTLRSKKSALLHYRW